jgi:hypothetical protein
VAASFTDVPALAGRLQKVEALLGSMDFAIESGVDSRIFKLAADELRNALDMDTP